MKRWVPTAPVESEGAKSLSERPDHDFEVLGTRFKSDGVTSAVVPPRERRDALVLARSYALWSGTR